MYVGTYYRYNISDVQNTVFLVLIKVLKDIERPQIDYKYPNKRKRSTFLNAQEWSTQTCLSLLERSKATIVYTHLLSPWPTCFDVQVVPEHQSQNPSRICDQGFINQIIEEKVFGPVNLDVHAPRIL